MKRDTRVAPALLTLVVSLLFTAGAWAAADRGVQTSERSQFDNEVQEIEDALRARWSAQEQVLRSGVSFIVSSQNVAPSEWLSFVNGLDLEAAYPGIQGVGWSIVVAPEDRAAHEAEYQRILEPYGLGRYSIYPVPGNEHVDSLLTSIVYLEPLDERNQRAISLDMYSEANRRDAMDRARRTGLPSLSGKIELVQEIDFDKQAGFLLYLPVFSPGQPGELVGWVYSPFRARDLMTGILGGRPLEISFEVFDGDAPSRAALLYDEDATLTLESTEEPDYMVERRATFAGRRWTIRFMADRGFDPRTDRRLPLAILISGLLVSTLLSSLVWSQGHTRERAVELATRMTKDLRASEMEKSKLADDLLRSNKDLEEFAYVASHDLQEPARTAQAYLGLLEADLDGVMDAEARENLTIAKRSAERMRVIVQDLLKYSLAARAGVLETQPVDLNRIASSVREEIRSSAGSAHAAIEIQGDLPVIAAQESPIERVLTNLVSNAIKYRSPNRPCRVQIQAETRDGQVTVRVTDNGIGIREEHLPRLFQMHSRLDPDDQNAGNGMGLAISRQSIERAGGSIGVQSTFGEGTTFWFTLPEWGDS